MMILYNCLILALREGFSEDFRRTFRPGRVGLIGRDFLVLGGRTMEVRVAWKGGN
jgi:hypothetical protein